MITLCVFSKKGDDEPLITYVGNIAFKKYKSDLFVYGASKEYDYFACVELKQQKDNLWYAYVEA